MKPMAKPGSGTLPVGALGVTAAAMLIAASAQASVTISSGATKHMSCAGGICAPTADKANLSISDVESMLKSENVTVTTTGSGTVQAKDIVLDAALTWKSASALTLSAFDHIAVKSSVSVTGTGGLVLNDAGTQSLAFYDGASVTFSNLTSALTINGNVYTLIANISQLANAVTNNRNGFYALAANYNAAGDGTYPGAPVQTDMDGTFEGLGNSISNITISDSAAEDPLDGFFRTLNGTASNFGLVGISVSNAPSEGGAGAGTLAGNFGGTVWRCSATGAVSDGFNGSAGGLVAGAGGSIIQSWTDVAVTTNGSQAGGITGETGGGAIIEQSFAFGSVTSVSDNVALGGLVGSNNGQIKDSYSTSGITMNYSSNSNSVLGGLAGAVHCCSTGRPTLVASYSTGAITAPTSACDHTDCIGGVVGYDDTNGQESYAKTYWDLDTSNVSNKSQGVGNIPNDAGIKGMHTSKFTAKLPAGFSTTIWAENPAINGGFPYLVANPPPK